MTTIYLKPLKDDAAKNLELEFKLIEKKLDKLNSLIYESKTILIQKFDNLHECIVVRNELNFINDGLNQSRENMVIKVNASFNTLLDYLNSKWSKLKFYIKNDLKKENKKNNVINFVNDFIKFKSNNYLKFKETTIKISSQLLEKLFDYFLNRNTLYMKFKYLNLYNYCNKDVPVEITTSLFDQNTNFYNKKQIVKVNRIVLTREKIFYFIELLNKQCFMLIKNHLNAEVIRSTFINLRYFESYQFLANSKYVVGLFYDDLNFVIKLFDSTNLRQIALKVFNFRIFLHSISKYEICIFTNLINANRYVILNFNLDVIESFGQRLFKDKPFYFGDGSLIQCSFSRIYIYFFDVFQQSHSIKILNRQSGLIERIIFIHDTKYQNIRLDSSFRLIIKFNMPITHSKDSKHDSKINYYDSNGEFLFEIKCNNLSNLSDFKNFEITLNDELFSSYPGKITFI